MKPVVAAMVLAVAALACAAPAKRDASVVRGYIRRAVGEKAVADIARKEGGSAFLRRFFADQDWMENIPLYAVEEYLKRKRGK